MAVSGRAQSLAWPRPLAPREVPVTSLSACPSYSRLGPRIKSADTAMTRNVSLSSFRRVTQRSANGEITVAERSL